MSTVPSSPRNRALVILHPARNRISTCYPTAFFRQHSDVATKCLAYRYRVFLISLVLFFWMWNQNRGRLQGLL